MPILFERYDDQVLRWPRAGRHILAQYDADSILVYQAYRPSIARHAVEHGVFGGDFSYGRMSWIKPNFLWMMYRSGWGTKEGQERILALRLSRPFFGRLLGTAISSTWRPEEFESEDAWRAALPNSEVRLQWDPDHDPSGARLDRRAIQIGLRGAILEEFGRHQLLEVVDLTEFVSEQRARLGAGGTAQLVTPREDVFLPPDAATAARLGMSREE